MTNASIMIIKVLGGTFLIKSSFGNVNVGFFKYFALFGFFVPK
jgi:hypothetical protein